MVNFLGGDADADAQRPDHQRRPDQVAPPCPIGLARVAGMARPRLGWIGLLRHAERSAHCPTVMATDDSDKPSGPRLPADPTRAQRKLPRPCTLPPSNDHYHLHPIRPPRDVTRDGRSPCSPRFGGRSVKPVSTSAPASRAKRPGGSLPAGARRRGPRRTAAGGSGRGGVAGHLRCMTPAIALNQVWSRTGLPDAGSPIALSSPNIASIAGQPAVVVGDRVGYVWAFLLGSGATLNGWPFHAGAPVDSTPSVDPTTGTIFVGSGNAASPYGGNYQAITPTQPPGDLWAVRAANPSTDPIRTTACRRGWRSAISRAARTSSRAPSGRTSTP